MLNILLDTTSSDGVFDGVASGLDFDTDAFILGVAVGIIISLTIIGIVKLAKFIIKENQKISENSNSKKDD